MVFNVWDVGGPAGMTTVNQCFFTDKALYVVIWNLALGEEAVANLQTWLLNIEVNVWGRGPVPRTFTVDPGHGALESGHLESNNCHYVWHQLLSCRDRSWLTCCVLFTVIY